MLRPTMKLAACCATLAIMFVPVTRGFAQQEQSPEVRAAVAKGQELLRRQVRTETNLGYIALATIALVKTGEPADSPLIKGLTSKLLSSVQGLEFVSGDNQYDNYVAAVVLMALAAIDSNKYFTQIDVVASHLMRKQNPNGSWDYVNRTTGDTSQSQYACLALWEAAACGVYVPLEVWDKALHWFITRQDPGGGFNYHPSDPKDGKPVNQPGITHSMSAAGAGTMILCRSQLPNLQPRARHIEHELLIPVEDVEGDGKYQPVVTREMVQAAVDRSNRWMASNIKIENPNGGHLYYYIYTLERYATFAELKRIGATNWYPAGCEFLVKAQQADGSWKEMYPPIVDTSFALLFLGRSTLRSLERIKVVRIGKGTMLGGRGVPSADGSAGLMLRKRDQFKKIAKSPIEDLLALIETPSEAKVSAKETAAALQTVDSSTLIRKVGSDLGKLRTLAKNEDPGVRQAAITALAKTMDYSAVPVLIESLRDEDVSVYRASRDGLRWISRKIGGVGLPDTPPKPEILEEKIQQWQQWFAKLQIELSSTQQFDE